MSFAIRILGTSLILGLTACGSSTSQNNQPTGSDAAVEGVSGTVAGAAFQARDAIIAQTAQWKSSYYPGTSTVLIFSDWPNLCDGIQAGVTPTNSRIVYFDVTEPASNQAQPISTPGAFTLVVDSANLSQSREFFAGYDLVDAHCGFTDGAALSGSLNLTDGNANAPKGALSLDFDDGGAVSGNFSISHTCPTTAVDTYLNRNPTCG